MSVHRQPVIIVGAGLSGLATALDVALLGGKALILESSDMVGGAAAYSGGMVWVGANHVEAREGIADDLQLAEAYVRALTVEHPELLDESAMLAWLRAAPQAMQHWEEIGAIKWEIIPDLADYHDEAPGALPVGRYLTNAVIDGSVLGAWREKLRVSPNVPVGMTYAEMHVKGRKASSMAREDSSNEDAGLAQHGGVPAFGRTDMQAAAVTDSDPLTFGTGVVAGFLARVLAEPDIQIRLSSPVTDLIRSQSGDVIGVLCEGPNGIERIEGPVVLATSTYDWDPELVREFLDLEPEDFSSLAPTSVAGTGITMARRAGAAVATVPATSIPIVPGWAAHNETGVSNGPEYALPHCMMVDSNGDRFCDDSYWVGIVRGALAPGDRHLPFFLIWDEQHHAKYGLGLTPPGGQYPEDIVKSAPTLEELGALLGINGPRLAQTASHFNQGARIGQDPDFGRGTVRFVQRFCGDPTHSPSPVLGPIEVGPFFGTRLKFVGTGIGSSGVHADGTGRVLREDGSTIPGLYAVGSVAALTTMGSGYNSGFALSRGLTVARFIAADVMS